MNETQDNNREESENPEVSVESSQQQGREITILDIELEQLKNERDEFKDKFFRLLADGENMRKRLQKDKLDYAQYAVQKVLIDFLSPLEHMESALQYADKMSEEVRNWVKGFDMILNQFKQVLSNQGVTTIEAVGCDFDPHCHEALEVIPTDKYPPGKIIAVNSRGYRMGERTIRPARVTVAKPIEPDNEPLVAAEEQ